MKLKTEMKFKITYLPILIITFFVKCEGSDKSQIEPENLIVDNNNINPKKTIQLADEQSKPNRLVDTNIDGYKMIHRFIDENDSLIGFMFAHEVVENIYDTIIITDANRSKSDLLYEIKWNELTNKSGVDIIGKKEFFGYKVTLDDDYFYIVMVDDDVNYTSDELLVKWNKRLKHFEILKT